MAAGSHFTGDYIDHEGIQIARDRIVVGRIGSIPTPFPVLKARVGIPGKDG